ncbi:hypothetical protein [Azonexus hydrophilus]|jgi:hypothetical protein|uniref:Uncharacterized protein n=1 Tax=Azonexus hydrophilus TaxID=418702 RepID=A0ABZ2XHQ4_9RHOO
MVATDSIGEKVGTATLIRTGFEQPYRQSQALRLNVSNRENGLQKSALMFSEGNFAYIVPAMSVVEKAGVEPSRLLFDLSGQSPRVLCALGAEDKGQAWTICAYPGSLEFAEVVLACASFEEILAAWFLFDCNDPRSIPTELMLSLVLIFPAVYASCGNGKRQMAREADRIVILDTFTNRLEQHKTLMNCQKLLREAEQ